MLCIAPRATARVGLWDCSPPISAIGSCEQEPYTVPRATARAGLLWDRSPPISVIGSSKQEPPLAPRAMARAGLLFGCVTYCYIYISAIGSSEPEPCTVPRATARAGLLFGCVTYCYIYISAISSNKQDALHSAPRHGTCWAAVGLQPPPLAPSVAASRCLHRGMQPWITAAVRAHRGARALGW